MRPILLVFLLITCCSVLCQETYKKGYIVKEGSDTTYGYIMDDLEENLSKSINFKQANGETKILVSPDIRAFGFDHGPVFREVGYADPHYNLQRQNHFAKVLLDGFYNLLCFRSKDILFFVVVTKDTSYLLYDDEMTQQGEVIEEGNYRNFLAFFARECSKVVTTAGKINYTEQDVTSYFISLEKCKGTFNTAIVRYSKPKTVTHILINAGGFAVDRKSEIFAQALMQFIWPSFNQKTSLNTGLAYSRHSDETITYYSQGKFETTFVTEILDIPLIIRYDILRGRIQPYIYGGAALGVRVEHETIAKISSFDPAEVVNTNNHSFGATVVLGGGLSVYLARGFLVNVDWHYDLLTHLPVVGIGYRSNRF